MKIVQLNIWQGKLGQPIMDLLNEEKPDFVCMQEVNDLQGSSGYKFFATLDEIKKEAGFDHAFMSPTYSSRYMERELEYGNVILSRLPFKSTKTLFTHGAYVRNFDVEQDGNDNDNNRNLQIASVETGGKTLNLLNHHGYWLYGTKAGNDETLRQMKIIADAARDREGPIIMCGDFNLAPDSESLGLVSKELRNLSVEYGLERTVQPLFSPVNEVIDYIFVNDRIRVKSFAKSDKLVSDHNALIMEFEV